LETIERKTVIL